MRVLGVVLVLLLTACATPFSHVGQTYESVVRIDADRGWGSGVYVGGYLLTAAHVVEAIESDTAEVTLHDGATVEVSIAAEVIGEGGTDKDYALIPVDLPVEPARVYCGPLQLGQPVVHVGSPAAGGEPLRVATYGRVSSLDIGERPLFSHAVGLDIRSSMGSSGGPIMSMDGQVVALLVGGMRHGNGSMWTAIAVRPPADICP